MEFRRQTGIIETLNLKSGILVQVTIFGIFKDLDQIEPISVNILMIGKIFKVGVSSLGVTIRKLSLVKFRILNNYIPIILHI